MSANPPASSPFQGSPPSPVLACSFLLLCSFAILLSFYAAESRHEDIQVMAFTISILALPGGLIGFFLNLPTEAHVHRAFLAGMVTGHMALFLSTSSSPHDRWQTMMHTAEAILAGFGIGGLLLGSTRPASAPQKPAQPPSPVKTQTDVDEDFQEIPTMTKAS